MDTDDRDPVPSDALTYCECGDPFCHGCDEEREPSGDHPMGGMGYERDYSDALASGRALKD